jgi:hypothetical protein
LTPNVLNEIAKNIQKESILDIIIQEMEVNNCFHLFLNTQNELTPFQIACKYKNEKFVKKILTIFEKKEMINEFLKIEINSIASTALLEASQSSSIQIIKKLIFLFENYDIKNYYLYLQKQDINGNTIFQNIFSSEKYDVKHFEILNLFITIFDKQILKEYFLKSSGKMFYSIVNSEDLKSLKIIFKFFSTKEDLNVLFTSIPKIFIKALWKNKKMVLFLMEKMQKIKFNFKPILSDNKNIVYSLLFTEMFKNFIPKKYFSSEKNNFYLMVEENSNQIIDAIISQKNQFQFLHIMHYATSMNKFETI